MSRDFDNFFNRRMVKAASKTQLLAGKNVLNTVLSLVYRDCSLGQLNTVCPEHQSEITNKDYVDFIEKFDKQWTSFYNGIHRKDAAE